MTDKIEKINTELNFKADLIQQVSEVAYMPALDSDAINKPSTKKIPISEVASLGVGFEPFAQIVQKATKQGQGGSGLYRIAVPKGTQMHKFKAENAFLGSVKNSSGNIAGQARIKPLAVNPTLIFMAIALSDISQKLSNIQETQQDIINFLIQKEKSAMKGDLKFLTNVLNNYKYNWNNLQYKESHHIKVLDIKQASERKIDFYHQQISASLTKKSLFQYKKQISKQMADIQGDFKDYQLSIYLYAYASFLGVMLLENYNENFLNEVVQNIKNYSYQYRELYTQTYNYIEQNINSSLEHKLAGGVGNITSQAGKLVGRVSFLKKKNIDQQFSKTAGKIEDYTLSNMEKMLGTLVENQSSHVRPFIDSINQLNRAYNEPVEVHFDKDNIYIASAG